MALCRQRIAGVRWQVIKRADVWQNLIVSSIPFISRPFQDLWSILLSYYICWYVRHQGQLTVETFKLEVQHSSCLSTGYDCPAHGNIKLMETYNYQKEKTYKLLPWVQKSVLLIFQCGKASLLHRLSQWDVHSLNSSSNNAQNSEHTDRQLGFGLEYIAGGFKKYQCNIKPAVVSEKWGYISRVQLYHLVQCN